MLNMLKFISIKLLIILSILVCTLNLPFEKVNAQTPKYYRVLNDEIYIYQDSSFLEPLFSIPKTYYVKVELQQGNAVKVSYGDGFKDCPVIVGYMKLDELTPSIVEPTTPFTIIKVSTDTSDILFNDYELKNPYFNLPKNEIMYYYGEINVNDKILCYVYYSNKLGYVDKSCLNPFSIIVNPDPIEVPKEPETDENENQETLSTQPSSVIGENLQIIIIVGISVICISVVYFLFKPQKNKTENEQNNFYPE